MSIKIDLKDQTALVTGVSSGIGYGIAKMLAQAGCDIAGCGSSPADSEGAQQFLDVVHSYGRVGKYISCDLRQADEIASFCQQSVDQFGKIDILVSNAGKNSFESARDCNEATWQENMDLNLKAHWLLGRQCYPFLKESSNGTIIIMSSNHAYHTIEGCFPYNVAKSALSGLVQSLAIEWGPDIRTVGIAPGFVDTSANEKWFNSFPDAKAERKRTIALHPAGKLASVEEIGALCAYLVSDFASFITGTTCLIDGGRSAIMQDRNR